MFKRFCIVGVGCLLFTTMADADIKSAIVHDFHADPEYCVINLPPRPDAWPGAIFTSNLRFPIVYGNSKDPALHSGPSVAIGSDDGLDIGANAGVGISSLFRISSDAADVARVVMSFPDAHIVDMDYGDLVRHIETSKDTIESAKRGQIPIIVVKAYVGTPLITVTKKAGASAEAWAKLEKDVKAGAKISAFDGNSISYQSGEPIVFAFETSEIHFDPGDLSKGKLNIQLASLPETLFAFRDGDSIANIAASIHLSTGLSIEEIKNKGILGGNASAVTRALRPLDFFKF